MPEIQNETQETPSMLRLIKLIFNHTYSNPESATSENAVVVSLMNSLGSDGHGAENIVSMIALAAARLRRLSSSPQLAEILLADSLTSTVAPVTGIAPEARNCGSKLGPL